MTAPIQHPPWCDVAACGVALELGHPTGAHHSRPIAIEAQADDQLGLSLCLWQSHGREVYVSMDWDRPRGLPVDGILLDLTDAAVLARAALDLLRLAGGAR